MSVTVFFLDYRGNDQVEIQHGLLDGLSEMGATPSVKKFREDLFSRVQLPATNIKGCILSGLQQSF